MSRFREYALDDDDLIAEGRLSGKELDDAVKKWKQLRPDPEETEPEERSI